MKIGGVFFGIILSSLPLLAEKIEGFTQLEYLDTTGKEWFDSGLKASGYFSVNAKLQSFAIGYSDPRNKLKEKNAIRYAMFGGGDAEDKNVIMVCASCWNGVSPYALSYYHGEGDLLSDTVKFKQNLYYESPSPGRPVVYTYKRSNDKKKVTLNWGGIDFNAAHTYSDFVSENNFYIAAVNTGDFTARPGIMRIWYFKIIDSRDNTVLRDYIPCRRKADGMVGLYDKVENKFYTNASEVGACMAGPIIQEEWVSSDDGKFDYQIEWTISGYKGSSALTGVPVLLKLSETSVADFSYSKCLENGADIAFSSKEDFSDRLPYEIDEWNPAGTSLIWVKVPTLSGKNTKIYMRYGRSAPAENLPSTEVWSDYLGVYHMSKYDEVTKTTPDSSAYGRHAKLVAGGNSTEPPEPQIVEGKVGKAIKTLIGSKLEAASHTSFPEKYDDMPLYFSVSIYAKKEYSKFEGWEDIIAQFENYKPENTTYRYGWGFEGKDAATKCGLYFGRMGSKSLLVDANEKNWQYRVMSADGYAVEAYLNGSLQASAKTNADDKGTDGVGGVGMGGVDKPVFISTGNMAQISDEVRFSRTDLSADRIKADYEMITSSSFVVGSPAISFKNSLTVMGTQTPYDSSELVYGMMEDLTLGEELVKTCPDFIYLDSAKTKRVPCIGWELIRTTVSGDEIIRTSSTTQNQEESKTKAIITIDGSMRLVWLFGGVECKIASEVVMPEGYDKTDFSCEEWQVAGTKLQYSYPQGLKAIFVEESSNKDFTAIPSSLNVKIYLMPENTPEHIWLYIKDKQKLVDVVRGWVFVDVTCDASNGLTIPHSANHIVPGKATTLDLSLPIYNVDGVVFNLVKISGSGYSHNLFKEDTSSKTTSDVVEKMILPKTLTTAHSGTFQYLDQTKYFEFLGDYNIINTRMFYTAYSCKQIRFHYFPPEPNNESSYTFVNCGYGDYRYRLEYPKFLENAWLNATNKGARYDIKLTGSELTKALEAYRGVFGKSAAEPQGWVTLNFINGVDKPKSKAALVSYNAPEPTDKVVLGVMGLPWNFSQTETYSPKYGYHEYQVGETISIIPPRRYFKYKGEYYMCKGYTLHTNPDEIIPYEAANRALTLPAGNYGLTWIWEVGGPGFRIKVR